MHDGARRRVARAISEDVVRLRDLAAAAGLESWRVALASTTEIQLSVAELGVDGLGRDAVGIEATTPEE